MSKSFPIYVLCVLVAIGCKREPAAAPTQATAETTNAPAPNVEKKPKSSDDLKIGKVEIDQPKGSGLRYAVGTLKNDSDHSRYGITVELALLDKSNQSLPTKASDYLQMLEPRKEWRFRALVVDSKAVSVKVSSVREEE
jgi:hypothetical protein